MLTLSPEARAYALDKGGIMFLEFIVVGDSSPFLTLFSLLPRFPWLSR